MHSPQGHNVYQHFRKCAIDYLKCWQKGNFWGVNCRFTANVGTLKYSVFYALMWPVWLIRPDTVTGHVKVGGKKLHLNLFYNNFILRSFLRENDTTWPVHTPLSSNGPRGGPVEEDESQGKGHSGACADWKRLPHRPGAVHQRGGPASTEFAGRCFSESPMKYLAG